MLREFLQVAGGDTQLAAALLANGLMKGDAASFKAGYDRESALHSAFEMYEIGPTAQERVRELLAAIRPEEAT